jgi:WD40 repeat protein
MHKDLGEIFVSCSDDKRVIIRKAKHNFEVFVEIETSTVREWHTLTYLALEPNQGTRVAIGSQNGYLFIYDMREGKFVYAKKVHLAGIEGFVWAADKIITCSSDLVINILKIGK